MLKEVDDIQQKCDSMGPEEDEPATAEAEVHPPWSFTTRNEFLASLIRSNRYDNCTGNNVELQVQTIAVDSVTYNKAIQRNMQLNEWYAQHIHSTFRSVS